MVNCALNYNDYIEQEVLSFLDRFVPESNSEYDALKAILSSREAGEPLEALYPILRSIGDDRLLESLLDASEVNDKSAQQNDTAGEGDAPSKEQSPQQIPNGQHNESQTAASAPDPTPAQQNPQRHPLLSLDAEIDLDLRGLSEFEAKLPAGAISGLDQFGCQSRIINLQSLFDRASELIRETDFTNNENPLFYDLLMAKQHISNNQRAFTRLRIGLTNRFEKDDAQQDEADEKSMLDESPEEETPDDVPDDLSDTLTEEELAEEEAFAALQAEEDARAEAEAKAEKKASEHARQERLRKEAKAREEQAHQEQRESETRAREEQSRQAEAHRQEEAYQSYSTEQFNDPYPYETQPYDPSAPFYAPQERPATAQQSYGDSFDAGREHQQYYDNAIDSGYAPQEPNARITPTEDQRAPEPISSDPQTPPAPCDTQPYDASVPFYAPQVTTTSTQQSYDDSFHAGYEQQPYRDASTTLDYAPQELFAQATPPEIQRGPEPSQGYSNDQQPASAPHDTLSYDAPAPFYDPHINPPSSEKGYDERVEVERKQQRYRDDLIDQERAAHAEAVHARSDEAFQSYAQRMDQSLGYQSFGKGHIDYSGAGQHGDTYQPYAFGAGGVVSPVSGSYNYRDTALQTNQDIYKSACESGTITSAQSRQMKDNLETARKEYEAAKGTENFEAAAKRYQDARRAMFELNRDIGNHTISVNRDSSPASNSANVSKISNKGQNDSFTAYRYTPTGVEGRSYDNGQSSGGAVIHHNEPGGRNGTGGVPFGSIFSERYIRDKYTTSEKESSWDILNRDTSLRRDGALRTLGGRLYDGAAHYVPGAGASLARKFYSMVQSGDESAPQSIRAFEQGRYYASAAGGVALALMSKNPGSVDAFMKQAAKAERQNFGFTRDLSDKEVTRRLHASMNESQAAKKQIRRTLEENHTLSAEERRNLAAQIREHKAMSRETNKWYNLQESRVKEKLQKEVLEDIHRAKGGGFVSSSASMRIDAQRKEIQLQRREIMKGQAERAEINKRISELQKKRKGDLSDLERSQLNAELRQERNRLSKLDSDSRLKALSRKDTELKKLKEDILKEHGGLRKNVRMKDLRSYRQNLLKESAEFEKKNFAAFRGIKNSQIEKHMKLLKQQNEIAKRKISDLLRKGNLTFDEKQQLQRLLAKMNENQAKIKAHADVLKFRNNRDAKLGIIDSMYDKMAKKKRRLRQGRNALTGFIMKPLQESDMIGAQGLAKGISFGMNPYVHRLVRGSVSVSLRYTGKALVGVGKLTGLDKPARAIKNAAKPAVDVAKKIVHTPSELKRRAIRTASDAAKRTADRLTPKFVKTGREAVHKGISAVNRRFKKSLVGRAYEAASRSLAKVKAAIHAASKLLSGLLVKAALIFLAFFLLMGIISSIIVSVGGSVPSFLIMGNETSDEKVNLSPYYNVVMDEWKDYEEELREILKKARESGKYYKTQLIMEPEPPNLRNILSMMAVRMSQNLDMSINLKVKPYLKSLTRDGNPYIREEGTCFCDSRNCKSRPCRSSCPDDCSGHPYCPGDHKTLTIIVKSLNFDDIFYADSMGNANQDVQQGDLIGNDFKITYYLPTGNQTASGTTPTAGRTIAVDPDVIPIGTRVIINGHEYIAEDTGPAVTGHVIDIFVDSESDIPAQGVHHNVSVYLADYVGEGIQASGEWHGWVEDNREWCKVIYSAPWQELYTGIPNITDAIGNDTDLSGVTFVDGTRPGNQSVVDLALSQLGNSGGEPYWSWYGFDYRVEWCATFVSWVANQSGTLGTSVPKFASCALEGVPWFQDHGQWTNGDDGYVPVAGDIIFFDWEPDGRPNHVGIVVGSDGTNVYTVEGNSSDTVRTKSYSLTSDVIFGYGLPNY